MNWLPIIILALVVISLFVALFKSHESYVRVMDEKVDHIKNKLIEYFPELDQIKVFSGNRSFTIDKKEIFLCLRDENGDYYNDNMLTYVLLHELSHVLCDEIGHTKKFFDIFDQVLAHAEANNVYDSSQPIIQNYCGT